MLNLTPDRLLDVIREQVQNLSDPILVFWCEMPDNDRDEYARQLQALIGEEPILPIVLRGNGFHDPNSISADLNRLFNDCREKLTSPEIAKIGCGRPLVMMILSRAPFCLPQISSPAVLPSWFPALGGQTVMTRVIDFARTADALLNSPDLPADALCTDLFELDGALLRRLTVVSQFDKQAGNAFHALLTDGKTSPQIYKDFLENAHIYRSTVVSPEGFRPSVKEQRCIVAALLKLFKASTADGMNRPASALKTALNLQLPADVPISDSVLAVLFRPIELDLDHGKRFSRNILITVYAASQLITARAHADAYPRFPIQLLRSMVHDLRRTLRHCLKTIENQLPCVPPS